MDEIEEKCQFNFTKKDDWYVSDKHPRKLLLSIAFILGMKIQDRLPADEKTWIDLCRVAAERRFNTNDVEKIDWSDMRQIIRWWWKKYHNVKKNRK